MKLYIDKENLGSLLAQKRDKRFRKCEDLLLNEMSLYFNFSKQEMQEDDRLSDFLLNLGDNDLKPSFCDEKQQKVPARDDLKSNFYRADPGYFTSVFLINEDRICDSVQQKSCILIGKVGEELEVLDRLVFDDNNDVFTHTISSWKDYVPQLPVTDVFISDEHYFADLWRYEKNANELIEALASVPKMSPINVTIITKRGQVDSQIDLREEQRRLQDMVKKMTESKESNVCIVLSTQLHNRYLISNYYRIDNGTCFHLRDAHLKKDVRTQTYSHADLHNEKISRELIHLYRKIIANTKGGVDLFGEFRCNLR